MAVIKCEVCNTVLHSKHVHDFQCCGCENETYIDGGNEYTRCGGKDLTKIKTIRNCITCKYAKLDKHVSNNCYLVFCDLDYHTHIIYYKDKNRVLITNHGNDFIHFENCSKWKGKNGNI